VSISARAVSTTPAYGGGVRLRQLGTSDLQVSEISLGSWLTYSGGVEADATAACTRAAFDAGITFFDTANVYGRGAAEEAWGRILADYRREDYVLATKVYFPMSDTDRGLSPAQVAKQIDASLARLRTDHVDLYQLHRVDPAVPLAETWGAMAELVAAGKARAIGLSEADPAQIREAHAVHPVTSVQSELSLWTPDVLAGVLPLTEELGIALIPFSPLGRGFLAGRFTSPDDLPAGDWRHGNPRFQADTMAQNQRIAAVVREQAALLGVTPAQLALAWVLAQGRFVVPIPGTKNPVYLRDNLAAASIAIPAEVLAVLDGLPAAAGRRY
jgi:aryl-alcohol dehydrogenase-like predicted oxidoreductase